MTPDDQHEVTYEGGVAMAHLLVQQLRDAGGEVRWEPPLEERSGVVELVVVPIVVTLSYDLTKATIRKFLARRRARVTLDGEPVEVKIE